MKLIAIGDVHGRDAWKQIDVNAADKVIFLGDYVDGYDYGDKAIYDNLEAIVQLKRSNPDKVVLLIGNHDAQYMHFPDYSCSGFRPTMQSRLGDFFTQHRPLFQIAYQQDSHLFTHAGVSQNWYHYREQYINRVDSDASLADRLNALYERSSTRDFLFDVGPRRGGGQAFGGPVWADRSETIKNYLPDYHQVVGHTPVPDITTAGGKNSSITYCDVTQTKADFYEVTL